MTLDRFQAGDLESDDHCICCDDGEAEREKADRDLDIAKNDLPAEKQTTKNKESAI